MLQRRLLTLFLVILVTAHTKFLSNGHPLDRIPFAIRAGAVSTSENADSCYEALAEFVMEKFPDASMEKLVDTLERMGAAQKTFKGLDGAAHEAYQRTHSSESIDTSVSGRAQRSAARVAATAEGLLACELVEMVEFPEFVSDDTLQERKVLLNYTISNSPLSLGKSKLSVVVLYEPEYRGGAGLDHGTIVSLTEDMRRGRPRGRILVIIADSLSDDLVGVMSILSQKPKRVKLSSGLVADEIASVQPTLYKAAGDLLEEIEPQLRKYSNTTAVHFIGRSLAGGVASLAATMLDGTLPLPKRKKQKGKGTKAKVESAVVKESEEESDSATDEKMENSTTPEIIPLSGLARARSSAITLGAPPCLSSNVLAAYCTSFLYGDDVVVRTTSDSVNRLCDRVKRNLKSGFVGRNIGWMSDTLTLTVSSLQTHAHGSEGEEANLSIAGRAYLVRPRRLGGLCSIHEVGNLNKGGREALRANLLWQLHDVLLSKSMWKHHSLESYIHGLDRVQLRGTTDEVKEEDMY